MGLFVAMHPFDAVRTCAGTSTSRPCIVAGLKPPQTTASSVMAKVHITLAELRARFDRPMADVAKEYGVGLTFMKKLCRKYAIKRWPYRKVMQRH